MRRELDIILEKHSLVKLRECYKLEGMPCVTLIETFKDFDNLYFLTELFEQKNELWKQCRSFGVISPKLAAYIFAQICRSVSQLHK